MTIREASNEASRRCGKSEAEIKQMNTDADAASNAAQIQQSFRQIKSGKEHFVITSFIKLERNGVIPDFPKILSLTIDPNNN